jgi:hypothetical protein
MEEINGVDEIQPQIKKKRAKLTEEEKKARRRENYKQNKNGIKDRQKENYQKNKEKYKECYIKNKEHKQKIKKIYREKNKDKIKESSRIYNQKNKEARKQYEKQYRKENREKKSEYGKLYRKKNREKRTQYEKEYYEKNGLAMLKHHREYTLDLKIKALEILGGCKCEFCEERRIRCLTIDHINSSGSQDRKNGLITSDLHRAIVNKKLTKEHLNNLRVLCWNHNSSRTREYLDLPKEKQNMGQKYRTKLWKEAFSFFGPCSCNISDLKFLTISHINNDGAEQRRNGEQTGTNLLVNFRKLKWPESLKETYCLECWNCNCSHGNKSEKF